MPCTHGYYHRDYCPTCRAIDAADERVRLAVAAERAACAAIAAKMAHVFASGREVFSCEAVNRILTEVAELIRERETTNEQLCCDDSLSSNQKGGSG